jgi:methionyl-tRNA formyltransferase
MTRILFMGTPQFAVPTLQALIDNHEVVAVVTQPDAPAGRGKSLTPSPVKQTALLHGLPVLQPPSLKPPEIVEELRSYAPDAIVVAAFGQILRRDVLDMPPHKCINVHASLLPRWRGAAPISAAIAAGDATTGVTIMLMEAGLDSGPMLSQRDIRIDPDDTTGSLTEKLSHLGAELLIDTLPAWFDGSLTPKRQNEALVTFAPRMAKEQGRIDWSRNAEMIERHVRAMSPWPSAFTSWQGKQVKILRARMTRDDARSKPPNGAVHVEYDRAFVQCDDGRLELLEVQIEGKRAMPIDVFLRGHGAFADAVLG